MCSVRTPCIVLKRYLWVVGSVGDHLLPCGLNFSLVTRGKDTVCTTCVLLLQVTGGRNGYGAKLCNIFSTEFTVETGYSQSGKVFKMVSARYSMHVEMGGESRTLVTVHVQSVHTCNTVNVEMMYMYSK